MIETKAIADRLGRSVSGLRKAVGEAVSNGHAAPALASAIGFYDTLRQGRGLANIIQAQRDFFGHHGFAILGEDGTQHGPWWH